MIAFFMALLLHSFVGRIFGINGLKYGDSRASVKIGFYHVVFSRKIFVITENILLNKLCVDFLIFSQTRCLNWNIAVGFADNIRALCAELCVCEKLERIWKKICVIRRIEEDYIKGFLACRTANEGCIVGGCYAALLEQMGLLCVFDDYFSSFTV